MLEHTKRNSFDICVYRPVSQVGGLLIFANLCASSSAPTAKGYPEAQARFYHGGTKIRSFPFEFMDRQMKMGFSDPGVLTKKHGEEFQIRSREMDRQLSMVWGEMDELGSIVKGLLFLPICGKDFRRARPLMFLRGRQKIKRSWLGW